MSGSKLRFAVDTGMMECDYNYTNVSNIILPLGLRLKYPDTSAEKSVNTRKYD